MRRLAIALAVLAALFPIAAGAATTTPILVGADRVMFAPPLGGTFTFTTPVVNTGAETLGGLVAHLNILSLEPGIYVDPEDWSSERTQYLPPLSPGATTTLRWKVKAVTAGSMGLTVTLLARDAAGGRPAVGPAIHATVAGRKTVDTSGLLVLVVGVPGLLGLVGVGSWRYRHRRRPPA